MNDLINELVYLNERIKELVEAGEEECQSVAGAEQIKKILQDIKREVDHGLGSCESAAEAMCEKYQERILQLEEEVEQYKEMASYN